MLGLSNWACGWLLVLFGFAAVAVGTSLPAQSRIADDPVVKATVAGDGVIVALHASGTWTASAFDDESGIVAVASTAPSGGEGGGDPVPTLTTSWCDAQGVTHTVSTPIQGTTDAGIKKAVAAHRALVTTMQALNPPKPCPTPVVPPGP